MKKTVILIASIFLMASAGAEEKTRDWTIERPLTAGFLNGVTLSACTACRLGAQAEPASEYDPYGMTGMVREELKRLGRRPWRIGQSLGAALAIFTIGGLFFRRRNRLRCMEEKKCT